MLLSGDTPAAEAVEHMKVSFVKFVKKRLHVTVAFAESLGTETLPP